MESKDIRHAPVVVFYGTDVPALYEVRRQYIAPDDTADVIRLEQPSAAEMMRQIETMDLFSTARRIEAVNPSWLVGAASEDRAVRQLLESSRNCRPIHACLSLRKADWTGGKKARRRYWPWR